MTVVFRLIFRGIWYYIPHSLLMRAQHATCIISFWSKQRHGAISKPNSLVLKELVLGRISYFSGGENGSWLSSRYGWCNGRVPIVLRLYFDVGLKVCVCKRLCVDVDLRVKAFLSLTHALTLFRLNHAFIKHDWSSRRFFRWNHSMSSDTIRHGKVAFSVKSVRSARLCARGSLRDIGTLVVVLDILEVRGAFCFDAACFSEYTH